MKAEIAAVLPACGLTFMCLHKRTNIRFVHNGETRARQTGDRNAQNLKTYNNMVKGVVVPALAPVALDYEVSAPSFYLQTHESNMSTARTVQYSVHHTSPTLDVTDVQQVANVLANILAPQATKLPMSTRCAHRLADVAERLLDAVPQLEYHMLPSPLNQRLWFM
ncbi:hypothetical protein STCU_10993 [Strigomonas culicis]|uniref:Uncharacterized protein n=1 Tax=Strigomonas culicis TaxID=28005 RepID=S9UQ68_9TRYP|nr:hypothetical protein STCU_10993 [Strigomonas culicis]|eukprot:EPY16786.1 hypothetical protein STCU_10993 [Strigomonas culicis]